ncbi:uncharacterized protein LOC105831001 [Monomorium pharaonis]|uniref:uncharacterized protein LOC105831001 n=1 Tax=Monomorium pharaonis TaxID=307658 RepID=UPI0017461F56|nr:uncharacterized protein LOC105831001 [Monomorium pharaonis]
MNVGSDIAQLSYKELQALAVRYRVPGNIKKKVLVKVLQTARSGNEVEFYRMLHELRKNRKRKTRKSRDSKLGMTSTPLHSPDYIMADDTYYYQQQQPQQQSPYQWCFPFLQIGAEEEIVSKEDDKIPHYEEFKQFLLKSFQREFEACDNNNNQVEDPSIVDLRTAPMSPNLQTIPLVEPSYTRTSPINDTDPLAISNDQSRSSYQVLKEPEESSQGSFLLKRMLQAPVGANLGEIASSLFWTGNILDNSDTLTAESECNENEEQLNVNTNEYYTNLLKNSRGEFLVNEASLVPQQVTGVLAGENQYRFSSEVENQPNSYQNWTITSVMEVPDNNYGDLQQSSKVFHAIYYNNTDPTGAVANVDKNLAYQYQTETACNGGQNFNFDTQDNINYTTGTTDMMTNDSSDIYYLQNFGKHNGEMGMRYFRNVDTFDQNNMQQNIYTNEQQYQYLYPRCTHQEMNNPLNERFEQQQNNFVTGYENNVNQETRTENFQRPVNGTTEKFWPKWTPEPNTNLENILNYHVSKQVDYSKLSQTSCVYCYVAPIVSQRSSLAINGCSIERRYTAEQRQHSFSPYWMLYNDTSQGMRMTNVLGNPVEQSVPTHTTIITNNDLRETTNNVSINDVWMNQYAQSSIANDIQMSDHLFYNVTVGRINEIPNAPDIAKT